MKRLEDYVSEEVAKGRKLIAVLYELYRDVESGAVRLRDPQPPQTFGQYLRNPAYSLWLWTCLALLASTLITIAITPYVPALLPLRYVLGSIYVLFLPGYALIEALYPEEKSLSPLERLALSIGLSLAVVPLIGLLLNYTPWGIRLGPIVVSTSVYTALLLFVAAYRKYRLIELVNTAKS